SNRDDLLELTAELLQSPIVYFNGHQDPDFSDKEKELLKQFVEQGGFIFAEACCGRPEFDRGFRKLVKELWKEHDLLDLKPDHPVWRSHFLVKPNSLDLPGKPYKLQGIEMGCKTVVIYSPQDLSCLWEANNVKDGRGQAAFRLGANIVAYATGMEPP